MSSNPYYSGPTGTISAPQALPEYPHPRDFDGKDPFNLRDARSVFARAPWFDVHAYKDVEFMRRYARAELLAGGIPLLALGTVEWDLHCAVAVSALSRGHNDSEKRARWAQMIYKRIKLTIGTQIIPDDFRLDPWAFRTDGEISFATRLAKLDYRRWDGVMGVRQEALLLDAPILRAEFRYLRKYELSFWYVNMRWERAVRNSLGYLVPHQMVEIDLLKLSARPARYVPVTAQFQAVEVPLGCCAELPPELTYLGSEMRTNAQSGLWVVFYSSWAARVAVFLLWDVCDTYRLWYVPPTLCGYMRILDLSVPLGSSTNYRELLDLLDVIEQTVWDRVPEDQRKRGAPRRVEYSPGRRGPGGDFLWYDPWTKSHLSCETARELREHPREMPHGTPHGYVFEPDPALLADDADEPMEDPDAEPEAGEGVCDSVTELQTRAAKPTRAGSSAAHSRLRNSRGNPLAGEEKYQQMEAVIQFLRDAGVRPAGLTGSYDDLVRFSASRLGVKRARGSIEGDLDGRNEKFRRGRDSSPGPS